MADGDPVATGASVPRRALDRFVAGRGQYVGDIAVAGALVVKLVRSEIPHARIRSIDLTAARAVRGVVSILTGADLAAVAPQPSLWDLPEQNYSQLKALATDRLLYVGHPYAAQAIRIELDPCRSISTPMRHSRLARRGCTTTGATTASSRSPGRPVISTPPSPPPP